MWQLSSKIPVVNSNFLEILVLISTLLSSICRSSCLYSRNTNISSVLGLSSMLLLKIRHFFYIVSLNIEWQGRFKLVGWHHVLPVQVLSTKLDVFCQESGSSEKFSWCFHHLRKNLLNYFLNFGQYRELTDLPSSVAVKSRVNYPF